MTFSAFEVLAASFFQREESDSGKREVPDTDRWNGNALVAAKPA